MVGCAQMPGYGKETQGDQQKRPSEGAVGDMDRRMARRDKANGFYV